MRERQRLAEGFLVDRVEPHGRASRSSPRAALGCEGGGILAHELLLIVGRQLHHPTSVVGAECRKNAAVHAEIWMAHVRALARASHAESNTPELLSRHDS